MTPARRVNEWQTPLGIGLAIFFHFFQFMSDLLALVPTVGKMHLAVMRMISDNVSSWLLLFLLFFLQYCLPMISFLDASSAREVWALVWDLLLLAWTGQPLEICLLYTSPSPRDRG